MVNKLSGLTAIALTAMLPSFASADVAASLSASFGTGGGTVGVNVGNATGTLVSPTSVSVAGAAGGFAVASSVATAYSSGAAAGATSNSDFPPLADVTYKGGAGAYETSVSFAPSPSAVAQITQAVIDDICGGLTGSLVDRHVTVMANPTGKLNDTDVNGIILNQPLYYVVDDNVNITGGNYSVANGAVTVSCS